MRETWVQSLGQEDPLEKEMATHSSTLAWKIPSMEGRGRLQSMGSWRVRQDWVTSCSLFTTNKTLDIIIINTVFLSYEVGASSECHELEYFHWPIAFQEWKDNVYFDCYGLVFTIIGSYSMKKKPAYQFVMEQNLSCYVYDLCPYPSACTLIYICA